MIAEEWIRERATVIDVTPEKELESYPHVYPCRVRSEEVLVLKLLP
jgi:hypothetical protein